MTSATSALDLLRIRDSLGDRLDRFGLRVLPECTSTNSVLMDEPPAEDGRVHVLACDHQSGGRGRRGKQWASWRGHSLTFSSLWRFQPGAPVPAGLSLVAGVAVARTLEQMGIQGVQLKWPNDVLVLGAKVAGILVELTPMRGRPPAAVIGIGLNITLPANVDLPAAAECALPPTSLAAHLPAAPDKNIVLAQLLCELDALLATYAAAGFASIRLAWEQRNAFAGLPVRVSGESRNQSGICIGVAEEDGALLLRTEHGIERILAGDVSLRESR